MNSVAEPGGVEVALRMAVALLLYPGGMFLLVAALLAEGLRRQFGARAQGRVAPRLLQPLFDLQQQFSRADTTTPVGTNQTMLRLTPIVVLAVLDVAAALTPLPGNLWPFFGTPVGTTAPGLDQRPFGADILAVALLLTLVPAAAEWVSGMLGGSVFAQIAAARTIQYQIAAGLPVLVALVAPAVAAGTLDFVAVATMPLDSMPALGGIKLVCATLFMVTTPGLLRRKPFATTGAGGEMLEGVTTDFGGGTQALVAVVRWAETAALSFIFAALYIPFATQNPLVALGGILTIWAVWGIAETLFQTLRPRDGLRFLVRWPMLAAFAIAVGVAVLAR